MRLVVRSRHARMPADVRTAKAQSPEAPVGVLVPPRLKPACRQRSRGKTQLPHHPRRRPGLLGPRLLRGRSPRRISTGWRRAVCASRSSTTPPAAGRRARALLTGYYPQQIRMDPPRGRHPRVGPHAAALAQAAGYRCYHSGKWHVVGRPEPVADGGFDHSYELEDHDRNFNPKDALKTTSQLPPVPKDSGYYTDHRVRRPRRSAA